MRTVVMGGLRLTKTQLKLVPLLAKGHSNLEIAEHLDLTVGTVSSYTEQISRQIPGDLPSKAKVTVWWRMYHGCDPLTGETITDSGSAK